MKTSQITSLTLAISFLLLSSCVQKKINTSSGDHPYNVQSTAKLKKSYQKFINAYNRHNSDLSVYFSDDFVLEILRPTSDHREIDYISEVKKQGFRDSLFGTSVKTIELAMLKPWVLSKIELSVKGKKVQDVALFNIQKGKIKKILFVWSMEHHNTFFDRKVSGPSSKSIRKSLKYMNDGYNNRDLKSSLKVVPDHIVFLKMNPEGVRDLSLTGKKRASFLKDLIQKGELWDSRQVKEIILPPYSFQHTAMSRNNILLTERIVLRRFDKGKLTFTINFVGAEEHSIHLLENFYKDNPLYNYNFILQD